MFEFLKKKRVAKATEEKAETEKTESKKTAEEKTGTAKKTGNREKCISFVAERAGISKDEAAELIDDARSRLGVTYGDFRRSRLWEVPANEQQERYERYLIRKKEKQLKSAALEARKSLMENDGWMVLRDSVLTEIRDGDPALPDFREAEAAIGEDYLPDTAENRAEFDHFKYRFETRANITHERDAFFRMFIDWLFTCRDYGYDMDDYFDYELFNKDKALRETFLSAGYREALSKMVNTDRTILARKGLFLKVFERYILRDWLDCDDCSTEEIRDFIERNPVFFAKAVRQSGGEGIRKIDSSGEQINELCKEFREHGNILEGVIPQHHLMSEFNPDSVNTIRICTLADADDEVHIMGAAVRFGRKGKDIDNYHQGGMCALVDKDSGTIISDAIDRSGTLHSMHPDSQKAFKGFRIPCWEEMKSLTKELAVFCMDKDRFIGWDLAVTSDGAIELVEGNSRSGFDILQAQDMTGRKALFDRYVDGLKERFGKEEV